MSAHSWLPRPLIMRLEAFFQAELESVRLIRSNLPQLHGAHSLAWKGNIHVAPRTPVSAWLVAHEIAHVLQQRDGRWKGGGLAQMLDLELEADEAAARFVNSYESALNAPPFRPARALTREYLRDVPCAIWRWNGRAWVPVAPTRNAPPRAPGFFVGQEYNDENGLYGIPPNPQRDLSNALALPDGFGLDSPIEKRRFVANMGAFLGAHDRLTRLLSTGRKLEELCDATIFKALRRALDGGGGGCPVRFELIQSLSNAGSFSYTTWSISINRAFLEKFLASPDMQTRVSMVIELADTLYHEARHCEQVFRILRFLAGAGFERQRIAEITDAPQSVIGTACTTPLKLPAIGWTPAALQAMRWYHSFFGENAMSRRNTLRDAGQAERERATWMGALTATVLSKSGKIGAELREIEDRIKDQKSMVAFLDQWKDVLDDDYRELAEEADAWRIGGEIAGLMRLNDEVMRTIAEYFEIGSATGVGNNCLLDTLYQLANNTTVSSQNNVDTMRQNLVETGIVLPGQMLDIYGAEGAHLLNALNMRIQVIQIVGGVAFAHPVVIGTGGPLHYVLHMGQHFVPLRLKPSQFQLTFQGKIFTTFKRR